MRKVILCLLSILLVAPLYGAGQRKKVAVVLSGGGAKGVAHVRALKVIEEAGIPIDYVVHKAPCCVFRCRPCRRRAVRRR